MATAAEIVCPECDENLKVSLAHIGKKVKCKHCGHAFVAKNPGEKPGKPGAKPAASPAAAPAPAAKKNPFADDDDEEDKKKIEVITDDEVPRCPHCAKELDPPDAKVCIHCGFNNVTRARAETKKIWAPSAEDWTMHLLPGVLAAITVISLIVWNIICYLKMREWMAGSFLEKDDVGATGQKEFYVRPGFFICMSVVLSILVIAPCVKYAYRRLYKEFTPPEQVKL